MAKNAITVMDEGKKSLDEINGKLKQTIDNVLAINDAALKVGKNFFNIKSPQGLNQSLGQNKTFVQQLNVELKERKRLEKALKTQLERNRQAESANAKALAQARLETQLLNQKNKEAAILSSKLATVYQKQSVKLTQLRKKYKDVALTQGESSKEAKKLLAQITELDNRLKRVDANVGQFQRSVGNYGKAMRGAVGAARSLAGAMGFLGGAFLVVRVFKDAFNRIREFDKEMQNMAGILRTTRPEIKEVEDRIISVAAASIKTSNEVAQLATSLFVLGKSKDDVLQLLEPVNNLSIALGATSEETGEFLVQTLNAFGKGSESAAEFADTIAAIRTSTSLDFQKMRDSFQYITPISNILGKDLAYTGAVVGVLADNGLKAESAGRLLATAQIKLATSGRTLQDALDELNDAYKEGKDGTELLSIANDSFGKQAAKIGVILATQQDRLQEYDNKIRQAGGSLDDLVNEQLKSLDAQLKITNSVWEEFILSLENGNGKISKALSGTLSFINGAIKGMTRFNRIFEEQLNIDEADTFNKTLKEQNELYKELGDSAERVAIERGDRARDVVEETKKEIETLKERNKILNNDDGFGAGFRKSSSLILPGIVSSKNPEIEENEEKLKGLTTKLATYNAVLTASESIIEQTDDSQKNLNSTNGNAVDIASKTIESLREKIKLERANIEGIDLEVDGNKEIISEKQKLIAKYQAEIDAILGVNKARKKGIEAVKGSIAFIQNEIKLLEEKRSKLANTSKEYQSYTEKIEAAKKALADFRIELEGVSEISSLGDLEGSLKRAIDILSKPKVIEGIENSGFDEIQARIDANEEAEEKIREAAKETAEYRKQLESDLAYALVDFTNTIFDAKIQKFDDEIQLNNDKYAQLLDNEKLSEEQRNALEAERERKNADIEKKKRAEQKKQAIFNKAISAVEIGINTAVGITKAIAASPLTGGLPWSALIAALGAIQLATVMATPIPQYKHGKKAGQGKDSIALLNDGGKDELKISKDGSMERITGRNVLDFVKKSDTIVPDASKFLSNLSDQELYENLHKHTILASVSHQKNTIDNYLMSKSIDKQTDRLIKAMQQNRPKINVHNNNSIGDDIAFQLALNKL